jgi:hypothetical protein
VLGNPLELQPKTLFRLATEIFIANISISGRRFTAKSIVCIIFILFVLDISVNGYLIAWIGQTANQTRLKISWN